MQSRLSQMFPSFDFKDVEIYSQLDKAVADLRFRYIETIPRTIEVDCFDREGDAAKIYVTAHWCSKERAAKFKAVFHHSANELRGGTIESELRHIHVEPTDPNYKLFPIRSNRHLHIVDALNELEKLLA